MAEPASNVAPLPSAAKQLTAGTSDAYQAIFQSLLSNKCENMIEKTKGGMSYLSWAYAVNELFKAAPSAKFKICEFGGELIRNTVNGELVFDEFGDPRVHNGEPYQKTPFGFFVKAKVTVLDVTREMRLPVLDEKHNVVKEPNAFDINTAGMRCLTKCIAMHGLGLFLYQGEDIPRDNPDGSTNAGKRGNKSDSATTNAAGNESTKGDGAKATTGKASTVTTVADLLATHTSKLALANTSTLLGYHQNAGKYFKGEELAKFRASITERAVALNVTLPELTGDAADTSKPKVSKPAAAAQPAASKPVSTATAKTPEAVPA